MSDELMALVDNMWDAAASVPNSAKDEYWMADDLRVRIMALCEVVQQQAYAAGAAEELARCVDLIQAQVARDFLVGETAMRDLLALLEAVRQ